MWIIVKIVWPFGWGKWFDLAVYNDSGSTRLIQCCKNKNGIKIFRDVAVGIAWKCDGHSSGITLESLRVIPS